jgi:hypothetical protein
MHRVAGRPTYLAPLVLVVGACLLALYFASLSENSADGAKADGANAGSKCISRHHQPLDDGKGPDGSSWRVTSSVRNNNGCDSWVLGVEFYPSGSAPGSWQGEWGIPAGGHLSRDFTISAEDEAQLSGRSISGVAGIRVHTIVFATTTGEKIIQHPRLPSSSLRRRYVWLRSLRYFLTFYPAGTRCKTATLIDGQGKVLGMIRGFEGSFVGPMQ